MSGIFSPPKIQAPQAPPPVPTLDTAADAAEKERRARRTPQGKASTILTGSGLGTVGSGASNQLFLGAG